MGWPENGEASPWTCGSTTCVARTTSASCRTKLAHHVSPLYELLSPACRSLSRRWSGLQVGLHWWKRRENERVLEIERKRRGMWENLRERQGRKRQWARSPEEKIRDWSWLAWVTIRGEGEQNKERGIGHGGFHVGNPHSRLFLFFFS